MAYRMAPVLVTLNDLEGDFPRSFSLCRPFQVQSVAHLCSILPDFNSQRTRAVPQRQLGFLYLLGERMCIKFEVCSFSFSYLLGCKILKLVM